jgi:hypothetical protein
MDIFKFLVLSLTFATTQAFAQGFLTDDDENPFASGPTTKRQDSNSNKSGKGQSTSPLNLSNSIELSYLASDYSYELKSNQDAIKYSTLAHVLDVSGQFFLNEDFRISTKNHYGIYEFDELATGISPNKISGNFLSVVLALDYQLSSEYNPLFGHFISFGYNYFANEPDVTSPLQITKSKSHNVVFAYKNQFPLFTQSSWGTEVHLSPSLKYDETPEDSGKKDFVYSIQFQAYYKYWFSSSYYLKAGIHSIYNHATFKDTGSRQTENTEITDQIHSLALGLGHAF